MFASGSLIEFNMAVYFVRQQPDELIKIGVARKPPRRLRDLQTGNPCRLELLGWIQADRLASYELEAMLHERYRDKHHSGEWFTITTGSVLDELTRAGINGFVAKNPAGTDASDAFEILGRDGDGIPEYAGVCHWVSLEVYECCPSCGCMCRMHDVSDTGLYSCQNCDEMTSFDDLPE